MYQATLFKPRVTTWYPIRFLLLSMIFSLMLALSPHKAQAATECSSVTEIPVAECEALVALYNSTNGSNWPYQEGWLVTNTPCSWYGVECTSNHVKSITLIDNLLSGDMPAEIGALSGLQSLILGRNQISSLPAEFGNLTSLQHLALHENQLTSLPATIGNLSSLQFLDVSNNQLSSLPVEIGNLSSLQKLYLSSNQLSILPTEIGNLSSLQELNLINTGLSSLPAEIGNLSSLQKLYVGSNQLSSLPTEIGNLSSLQELDLSSNQLSNWPVELSNLFSLRFLNISANSSLTGPLPLSLLQLSALQFFDFSSTNLCEPPDRIFQSWLAQFPEWTQTNVTCTSPEGGWGTVTILLNAQPHSSQNFSFSGSLGNFQLDDAMPDDSDAYTQTKIVDVLPGTYTVREQEPVQFLLSDIQCEPAGSSTVDLVNKQVVITISANSHVTCTFTNQLKSEQPITFLKAVVGGNAQPSEWLFDIPGSEQDIPHNGQANLVPGTYTVFEDATLQNHAYYEPTAASGACALVYGQIVLTVPEQAATCTITNTFRTAFSILVTTVEDELNSDGDCSLREASSAANTNTAVDACGAGAPGLDSIAFAVTGTILLSSALPAIDDDLILNGPGADLLTLSGNNSVGVLSVNEDASLTVNNLTVAQAVGSSMVNRGELVVVASVITNNNFGYNDGIETPSGAGILNHGTLTVIGTLIDHNGVETGDVSMGGGLVNNGTATVLGSTISNNIAGFGAGIVNGGVLEVTDSTISRYRARGGAERVGGIANGGTLTLTHSTVERNGASMIGGIGSGGNLAIINSTISYNGAGESAGGMLIAGTAMIVNSTIVGNRSVDDFGGILNSGSLTISSSTFMGNRGPGGGAIANTGTTTVGNTVLVGNDSLDYPGSRNCEGMIISVGHNLDADGTCQLTSPGDIPNGNANLAELADHGGATQTLALLPGSDAIDAGDNELCAAPPVNNQDQRGLPRPVDGDGDGTAGCDIGAYEVQGTSQPPLSGTIEIWLDTQPNSLMDLEFEGSFAFRLDNAVPDDQDAVPSQRTFEVAPGLYTIRQRPHRNFIFDGLVCDNDAANIDLTMRQVDITVAAGSHITCTFTNLRRSIVRAVAYKDNNHNGRLDAGEAPLNQWRVSYYDAEGNFYTGSPEGPTTNNLTNQQGKDGISNVPAGEYTVCIEVKDGWFNTQPGAVHPEYGQACYEVTVAPGKIVEVYFGNTDYPLAGAAQADASSGVILRDIPDAADVLDDAAWLTAPLQAPVLFMPLITTDE